MKKENKISCIIIIYNEEKVIKRCLDSIKGYVDEIIIIHDGKCTDNSLKICKKYTKKIYELEHKGMCEFHYINALKYAKYNWIMKLDADEFLSKPIQDRLDNLINSKDYDAYEFVWGRWNGKRYLDSSFSFKKILFRKDKICFLENSHINYEVLGSSYYTGLFLEHKPLYNNYTKRIFKKKMIKWIKIQAKMYFIETKDKRNYKLTEEKLKIEEKRRKKIILFPTSIIIMGWIIYFKQWVLSGFKLKEGDKIVLDLMNIYNLELVKTIKNIKKMKEQMILFHHDYEGVS
jgi:glycosyltransferase involved in cell wall biosynthesis